MSMIKLAEAMAFGTPVKDIPISTGITVYYKGRELVVKPFSATGVAIYEKGVNVTREFNELQRATITTLAAEQSGA